MSLDEQITDPNGGGNDAGTEESTQAPQAPAARTYSDRDMAEARRSFQADSQREWARREAAIRSEFESRFVQREQPKPNDPYSQFDPTVAQTMRALFEHEFGQRLTPFQTQAEDLSLAHDEARLAAKFPDYQQNRVDVLEFAVQNNIVNLEQAYRAWKYDELSQFDEEAIRRDERGKYAKRKAAQAAGTPSVEGRGGGAPSSKQTFKNREEMDQAAEAMVRSANENNA